MPMTQNKAQELLQTYENALNKVAGALTGLDSTAQSPTFTFIPNLLKALNAIASPNAMPDDYSVEQAQTDLADSVKEKKAMRSGNINPTTLEHLVKQYNAQEILTLQTEIREGLNAEVVAEVTPTVDGSATNLIIEPESQDDNTSFTSENRSDVGYDNTDDNTSVTNEIANKHVPEQVEQFVDDFDLSFWLKVGSLSVALVASIALSVVAVMTANPVLLGVGVVASAVSAVALARTFNFFTSNTEVSNDEQENGIELAPIMGNY